MKNVSTVLSKHVFTEKSVYRLTYYVISKGRNYGIMITSEKFRHMDLLFKKNPITTDTVTKIAMLEGKEFSEVLQLTETMAANIVFPSTLKDILDEI